MNIFKIKLFCQSFKDYTLIGRHSFATYSSLHERVHETNKLHVYEKYYFQLDET